MLMLLSIMFNLKMFYYKNIMKIPMSSNLNYFWNFGFSLGLFMFMQTISGFLITMNFSPVEAKAFTSVFYLQNDIYYGWLLYSFHSVGVSFIFILLYLHMLRSIYYKYYKNIILWNSGMVMFLMLIIISFLGYSLPWNQMSYWAAKVITSLITVIYYLGSDIVLYLWGDFTVSGPTLQRFYSFHFLLPMILWVIILLHILLLHNSGSSNPFGLKSKKDMIPFFPYYSMKDIYFITMILTIMLFIIFFKNTMFLECDSFMPSNKLVTPNHIKPDWFLLWAYAILRSISSKSGGVMCLMMVFLILFLFKYFGNYYYKTTNKYYFWDFIFISLLLSYCGGAMLEYPFIQLSQFIMSLFFYYLLFMIPY